MRKEILLTGFGGQGLILAGILMAESAVLYQGLNATQNQAYGIEARGGECRSEVILSDATIHHADVDEPDVVLCMSQAAFDKFAPMVKEGGLSKESAQKLADQHLKAMERYEAWRFQKGNEQIKAWEAEVRDHPEYGGVRLDQSVETAKNMLHRYGSPKLVKEFNDMGVLSHPEFMYMLMRVSKDVSEGVSIGGAGQAAPERDLANRMFPEYE